MIIQLLQPKEEKETCITGNQLAKLLGIKGRQLEPLKRMGQVEYKSTGKQSWRYKLESVTKELIKKQT